MNSPIVLGVDAGGTKTSVIIGELVHGNLRTLSRSTGPPGNPQSVGFDDAMCSLHQTVCDAFSDAEMSPTTQVTCASLNIAGAGRLDDQQRIRQWGRRIDLADEILVVGDAECLLAAAGVNEDEDGVALIAGTGSIAWGRSHTGKTSRAGGFGFLFDDGGSGYWIATEALRQIVKAADARQGATSLLPAVLNHLQLHSPQELIPWCYETAHPRTRIAALAPIVFEQFPHDGVAQSIIRAGAVELATLVAGVVGQLRIAAPGFTLACTGSLLLKQSLYRDLVQAELRRLNSMAEHFRLVEDPAWGALQLARRRVSSPPRTD